MSPLPSPPSDLRRFPASRLRPGTLLYRVHRAANTPLWYSAAGSGRFDLGDGRGTLYLSTSALGAMVEVFRTGTVIPELEVAARRLTRVETSAPLVLANCASARARGFGITAEIHSTPDYGRTQEWTRAFDAAGFDGVRYLVRHDPAQRQVGIGLFGPAGVHDDPPVLDTRGIDVALVRRLARRFGVIVAPTP